MTNEQYDYYKSYIKKHLFDFFWEGNDYLIKKFHLTLQDHINIEEELNTYFSYEKFKEIEDDMINEGYLVSDDSIYFYCTLIDRTFDQYQTNETYNR